MATSGPVLSSTIIQTPIVDPKTGRLTAPAQQWFMNTGRIINEAFDQQTQFKGQIGSTAILAGRSAGLTDMLQNISDTGNVAADAIAGPGTVNPAVLPPATTAAHGTIQLPPGASTSILGTAALQNVAAFDAAGSAAAAQAAAEAASDPVGSAATAQANAEAFSSNASNLTSGTVANARLGGLSITITTAKLTVGGTNGSMTFTNGVLTSQVAAT